MQKNGAFLCIFERFRIEFKFIDQEHFSRMCIRIGYKVNSCEKREVRASNSKSMCSELLTYVYVYWIPNSGSVLHFFVRFCAFFCQSELQQKRKSAQNSAKMCKQRFYAIPPLVIPPFACHRLRCVQFQESRIDPWPRYFWKVSRYTSHFYRDTFAKVCPLFGRESYIHHQFVSRYASHLYRNAFAEVLGWGVVGTLPTWIG